MSTRIEWIARITPLVALAVAIAGCGKQQSVLAPDEAVRAVAAERSGAAPDDQRHARGEARQAQPITGPTTISSPGNYRLTGDFETLEGDGIVITASNVRLWLGGHRLTGPGNKVGRGIVIEGAENVQVAGGQIERFGIGAALNDASRCKVQDLDVRGGDETADPAAGNPPQIGILLVNSAMNAISGNELERLNLAIFVRGGDSYGNSITDNQAVAGDHGLLGICYNPAAGAGPAGPHDDRVTGNLLERFGVGISASAQSAGNRFTGNTILYFTAAYQDLNGTNVFIHNDTEQIAP